MTGAGVSVQFNGEPGAGAVKIHNVPGNHLLSLEVQAAKPVAAKRGHRIRSPGVISRPSFRASASFSVLTGLIACDFQDLTPCPSPFRRGKPDRSLRPLSSVLISALIFPDLDFSRLIEWCELTPRRIRTPPRTAVLARVLAQTSVNSRAFVARS